MSETTLKLIRILLATVAVLCIVGVVAGVVTASNERSEFAYAAWWCFPIGFYVALLISRHLIPLKADGMPAHLLRALIFMLFLGPVFMGPEGTWVAAIMMVLAGLLQLAAPGQLLSFINAMIVQFPMNWIAPVLVFGASLCVSQFLEYSDWE